MTIVVVALLGTVGWLFYQNSQKSTTQTATVSKPVVAKTAPVNDPTKDWTLVVPKNSDNTFSVKVPKSLLPNGTCATKEVLLAITFNSSTTNYPCNGLKDALGYASIVFGISTGSVATTLGTPKSSVKLTLADGKTVATKSIITAQAKGEGVNYTARYELYEAIGLKTGDHFYAVYSTGVGLSDENHFLNDFEAAVTRGWSVP